MTPKICKRFRQFNLKILARTKHKQYATNPRTYWDPNLRKPNFLKLQII